MSCNAYFGAGSVSVLAGEPCRANVTLLYVSLINNYNKINRQANITRKLSGMFRCKARSSRCV